MPAPDRGGDASICIDCGLCCDGTLHGHTDLAQSDRSPAMACGLPVERLEDRLVFRQPCPKFAGGICSIYAARPEPCRGYRCKLRKDFDEGRLDAAKAREKIEIAKLLVANIKDHGAWADTPAIRATIWRGLQTTFDKLRGEERARRGRVLLDIAALDFCLGRWFKRTDPVEKAARP